LDLACLERLSVQSPPAGLPWHRIEERKEKQPCFTLTKKRTLASSKANCQRATLFASLNYAEKEDTLFAFSKIHRNEDKLFL
jgi:hypothetical protein